jgi:OOP family OmpA-OmpF porin
MSAPIAACRRLFASRLIPIGLCVIACPVEAGADGASPFDVPGMYIGGEVGASGYANGCEAQALSCDRRATAWGASVGYRFDRLMGVELGYLDLGQAHATYPRSTGPLQVQGDVKGYHVSALFGIPVGENARFFLRAGGYRWQAKTQSTEFETREDGWSATAGGGFEWRMAPSWQLRAQALYLDHIGGTNTGGANGLVASVGIVYFFSARP